jgi:small-conductance mechanosensitive channel
MIKTIFTDYRTAFIVGIILAVTIFIALFSRYLTANYINKLVIYKQIDPTSYVFAKNVITAIIYLVGISFALVQIPEMKIVGHSLLAGAVDNRTPEEILNNVPEVVSRVVALGNSSVTLKAWAY